MKRKDVILIGRPSRSSPVPRASLFLPGPDSELQKAREERNLEIIRSGGDPGGSAEELPQQWDRWSGSQQVGSSSSCLPPKLFCPFCFPYRISLKAFDATKVTVLKKKFFFILDTCRFISSYKEQHRDALCPLLFPLCGNL